ncbi:GyrI-like domain-containing protein [Halobacillus locisalis]|uniref:GyrI-like domain-containing protein n=1 Tax=Halobacillus locisalis TaxID=220753 RepID=A0A838CW66_9BACI|nr:GyrI-like domain-containing protein [Halobacillus locisalis]MBA2176005.1 GyrI-like domain-containing protein [Halobacillus locisalis]
MEPEIVHLKPKKLVGKSRVMSLAEDRTQELWKSFMPNRSSIPHQVDHHLYDMKRFDPPFNPAQFNADVSFEKWAAVEVSDGHEESHGMRMTELVGGVYAVFLHYGPAQAFSETLGYIFGSWLPSSGYELDDREHFERFTEAYHPMDEQAVEEVWIPIK